MDDMELSGNSELFDLLVKNVNGWAIFTLDAKGRVASWNESAEKLLGYRDKEILGQRPDLFFTAEDREKKEPEKELATAVEVGQASDDRWIVRKDQLQFWCSGLTIALKDGTLRGFAKVMRDQTDMKQALDEVTRLNHKLQETIRTLNQAQERLYDKVRDLEQFEEAVVGRELEMIKLKRKLKDTESKLTRLRKTAVVSHLSICRITGTETWIRPSHIEHDCTEMERSESSRRRIAMPSGLTSQWNTYAQQSLPLH